MTYHKVLIPLIYFFLANPTSFADVGLPALFSDNMVIQQENGSPEIIRILLRTK